MTKDNADLLEQIIICGRLPKKVDGKVDLYKINKLLQVLVDTNHRVAVLHRLMDHNTRASNIPHKPGIDPNRGTTHLKLARAQ